MMERYYFIVEEALRLELYFSLVAAPAYGAQAAFVGTVRSPNRGQVVTSIDYQGYEAMMKTQMAVIADELEANYQLGVFVMAHRLGLLKPGEASIAIVISAPHRADALAACQQAIERTKELLPVWKYETREEGADWVAGSRKAAEPL
ncbi:MAG: molybdenum cofactor biosynthesis protein MoaE [Deinococcales bacterium]